jgi:predicted DNA-binding transcriptional regulator YafY
MKPLNTVIGTAQLSAWQPVSGITWVQCRAAEHARRFTVPKKFDLNEYLSGSLGLFKGQDDFEVVVELDAFAADDVRGRRLHSSQEVTEMPGGMLRVRLRLDSLEEAERWVLTLGTHATVIRPEQLRERLSKATEELWQWYGGPMVLHGT